MKTKISILHLEDQEADAILVKSYLDRSLKNIDYHFVDDEMDFIGALKETKIDLILSDYQLPDYSGMEALEYVKSNFPQIPFIFVTGKMGEDAAIDSLLKGATDYVLKSKPERLVPAIRRVLHETSIMQERIASEIALRESEERYRGLIMNLDAGVIVHAPDSSIIMSNPKASELLGLSEDQLKGVRAVDPLWNFLNEDYSPMLVEHYPVNQILRRKKSIKDLRLGVNRPVTSDIVWVTVNGSPVWDNSGEIAEIVISFLDITERKHAEEALIKEQYLMETLMNNIPDHLYFKDLESRFIRMSKSHLQFFKLKDGNEAIGKTDFDFFTEEHARAAYLDEMEIIRTGNPLMKEEKETWADRSETWVLTTKMPLRDQEGKIIGTFGISKDITERKMFEHELLEAKEKAEANDRLKTAFIRNISHEILTPLNGILGFGPMLTDESISKEQKEEFLELVNESSTRLLSTVNNIMDISLLVSGNAKLNISPLSPNKLIQEIREKYLPVCRHKKLELTIRDESNAMDFLVDSDHEVLLKILGHLVDNAIKFTTAGSISLGFNAREELIEFSVTDTGIGMNEETKKRMFEPFMQLDYELNRSHEGSGLGLSIAKGFIDLLGGQIQVESNIHQGSIFRFTIPVKMNEKHLFQRRAK